jgi:hypothetical protein
MSTLTWCVCDLYFAVNLGAHRSRGSSDNRPPPLCATAGENTNPTPETPDLKPETRSTRLETRNPKPETRNPRPETRDPKPEIRNSKSEIRNPKTETRNARGSQPAWQKPRPLQGYLAYQRTPTTLGPSYGRVLGWCVFL